MYGPHNKTWSVHLWSPNFRLVAWNSIETLVQPLSHIFICDVLSVHDFGNNKSFVLNHLGAEYCFQQSSIYHTLLLTLVNVFFTTVLYKKKHNSINMNVYSVLLFALFCCSLISVWFFNTYLGTITSVFHTGRQISRISTCYDPLFIYNLFFFYLTFANYFYIEVYYIFIKINPFYLFPARATRRNL